MKHILFLLLFVLSSLNVKAQVVDYPETYDWQPLSALIDQKKTSRTNTALSMISQKPVSLIKRTIESIDKSKKILAVAITDNSGSSMFDSNKFVYFSENPNDDGKGSLNVNTVRLSINFDDVKLKYKNLQKNKTGWAVYWFKKDMYLCDADDGALIENVSVYFDTGNGRKFIEATKSAEQNGTIEEMEAIARVYSDGNLSHVQLVGSISPDLEKAGLWKSRAEDKRRIKRETEEAKRKAEELERQKKAEQEAREKKEQEEILEALREVMNKKYGKKWVDLADRGDIEVGMHEDLVGLVCKYNGIELNETYVNGYVRKYDMYTYRSIPTGYQSSKITNVWIGSITIRNHKVASIIRGKRWSR